MQRVQSIAKRASRRAFVRTWLRVAGPALVAGSALSLAAVLTDRLIGPGLTWWPFVAAPIAAALLGATAWALWKRRDPFAAAVEVDTRLRLRDKLGTGLAFAGTGSIDDPFVAMSLEEADEAASRVDLKRAIPLKLGNAWVAWPVLACLAATCGVLMPPLRLLDEHEPPPLIAYSNEQVDRARAAIEEAAQQIQSEPQPDASVADAPLDPQREALDLLKKQLTEGSKSPDEALATAASVLEEEAQEAQREAERREAAQAAAREALSDIPPEPADAGASPTSPDEPFDPAAIREALRRGEPDKAAEALRQLREQVERMPGAQRREVAEQMDALARDLRAAADRQDQQASQDRQREQQSLQDMGLSPDEARRLLSETDPQPIEQALRERGVDEEAASKAAERLAGENAQRTAREEASERTERLSDAARQAAEEVRDEPPPAPPEAPPTGPQNKPGADEAPSNKDTTTPGADKPRGTPPDPSTTADSPQESQQSGRQPQQRDQSASPDQRGNDPSKGAANDPAKDPAAKPAPRQDPRDPNQPTESQQSDKQQGAKEERTQTGEKAGGEPGTKSKPTDQPQPGPNPPTPTQTSPNEKQTPGQSPQDAPKDPPTPNESTPSDSRPSKDGTPQPKADPNQPPSPDLQKQPGEPSKEQKPTQGGADQTPTPTPQTQPNQPNQPSETPQQQPDQQGPGDRNPQATPAGDQNAQPGDANSQQPGQTTEGQAQERGGGSPQQGEQPGADNSQGSGGMQQMEDQLRQMAEQAEQSRAKGQQAERLRDQARRMIEQASPEQREQMRRWAQKQREESGSGDGSGMGVDNTPIPADSTGGFRTQDVDARRPSDRAASERVAGEWTDPNQQPERGPTTTSNREIATTLRDAQKSAEQAIEDQTVPSRYRNVREYFRKAVERAEREAAKAPAPAAQDATSNKK